MNKVITKTTNTDTINFYCENCNKELEVLEVKDDDDFEYGTEKNKCTIIHLNCKNCDNKTYIKFYW